MVIIGEPEIIDASMSGAKAILKRRTDRNIAVFRKIENTSPLAFERENRAPLIPNRPIEKTPSRDIAVTARKHQNTIESQLSEAISNDLGRP